jgi:adenylate cyclase
VGGREVRTHPDGSFLVDFRSPKVAAAYRRIAPAKVIEWQIRSRKEGVPPEARAALAGKIVVWGVNVGGDGDVVSSPVDPVYDGPELQATILDNLLHGGERVRASPALNLAWTVGVAALVGLLTLAPHGRRLPHLLAFLALAAAVAVGFLVFRGGTALDLFVPLVAGALTWGAGTAFTLLTEGRYNKWLESTFSRYLAPSVIDALKRDPQLLQLGGTKRELTVLFSDIAGFTTISEEIGATQVSQLLNHYLTPHCDAVFAHDGVVDKFIGDAVVAFYGDPIPQHDHALRGCRTALDVQAALPALEPVWRRMGLTKFEVRVGLNSGVASVGNMGSQQRFNYTALGDTVNLASRLEGANKAFGTRILMGEGTRSGAGDAVLAKPLGRLVVVGKEEPVGVYELVALRERATPEQVRHVAAFERAVAAAQAGDLAAARAALAEAAALVPGDGACAWFGALLGRLASGAEPSPWSGVVTLTGK